MNFDVHHVDVTSSTNDEAWAAAAAGEAAGFLMCARKQESGRGQWQRVWVSPVGGLYFSFVLRPHADTRYWPELSGAIAHAIAEAVRSIMGVGADDVWVKDPNDVICAQGKLCGTVLESRGDAVVVGCGLNVFHPAEPIVTDGRNVPAYLCDVGAGEAALRALAGVPGGASGEGEHDEGGERGELAPEVRDACLDAVLARLIEGIGVTIDAFEAAHVEA